MAIYVKMNVWTQVVQQKFPSIQASAIPIDFFP
jgi:hypothetical protein